MRIQNNIESLNAYRNLNTTNRALSRSLERLSSGYRINRAADDAAGLAISEKMRSQIRGLNQAVRNAQDGISLIQTAEGALNESHSILQAMRELANQSANDTYTAEDRAAIQQDIDQLTTEITRIGVTTEFNSENLLDGSYSGKMHIGANEGQNMDISIGDMRAETLGIASAEGFAHEITVEVDANASTDASDLAIADGENTYDVVQLDSVTTVGTIDANYALTDASGEYVAYSADGESYTLLTAAQVNLGDGTLAEASGTGDGIDAIAFGNAVTSGQVVIDTDFASNAISATATANIQLADGAELSSGTYSVVGSEHNLIEGTNLGLVDGSGNMVGTSADGETFVSFEDSGQDLFVIGTSANALEAGDEITVTGDGGIDVSSRTAANDALTVLDNAIEQVSSQRSMLGALQNRLEHTITNLEVASENLTAAESRIRDVDMAAEMMEFTKNQILTQAGTAMLAQANMAPQAVLQLLG